jgi:transposase
MSSGSYFPPPVKSVKIPKKNGGERCFSRLKQFRRFATRYDKNRICFQAFVALACSSILLLSIVDTA